MKFTSENLKWLIGQYLEANKDQLNVDGTLPGTTLRYDEAEKLLMDFHLFCEEGGMDNGEG